MTYNGRKKVKLTIREAKAPPVKHNQLLIFKQKSFFTYKGDYPYSLNSVFGKTDVFIPVFNKISIFEYDSFV